MRWVQGAVGRPRSQRGQAVGNTLGKHLGACSRVTTLACRMPVQRNKFHPEAFGPRQNKIDMFEMVTSCRHSVETASRQNLTGELH